MSKIVTASVEVKDQETYDYICAVAKISDIPVTTVRPRFPRYIYVAEETIHHGTMVRSTVSLEEFISMLRVKNKPATYTVGNEEFSVRNDSLYTKGGICISRNVIDKIYKRYTETNPIVLQLDEDNWEITNRIVKKVFPKLQEAVATNIFHDWLIYYPNSIEYMIYELPKRATHAANLETFVQVVEESLEPIILEGIYPVVIDKNIIRIGCLNLEKKDIEGIMALFGK